LSRHEGLYQHLHTLAEPIRVRILLLLSKAELGVGELARVTQLPQSTVSRHLKALRLDGWVSRRSEGTSSLFRLGELKPHPAELWRVVSAQAELDSTVLRRLEMVLESRKMDDNGFFRRVAERWDQLRVELYGDNFFVPTLLALLPREYAVADIGCGTGEVLALLASSVSRVIGVDREQAMLDAAARRCEHFSNIELKLGEIDSLPIDDQALDAALCMLVLHHLSDVEGAFYEARRVLKPGGRLIVLDMVAHNRRDYRTSMGHRHLGFSQDLITHLAANAQLSLLRFQEIPPDPEAQGPALFVAVFENA
jgi:ubiquinone/menaquinone biosynthesis C-methylase UbiE/DNA-binding transcriptional ArsR family regulator